MSTMPSAPPSCNAPVSSALLSLVPPAPSDVALPAAFPDLVPPMIAASLARSPRRLQKLICLAYQYRAELASIASSLSVPCLVYRPDAALLESLAPCGVGTAPDTQVYMEFFALAGTAPGFATITQLYDMLTDAQANAMPVLCFSKATRLGTFVRIPRVLVPRVLA